MSRILLDQNMPIGLRGILSKHEVITSFEMGWGTLENGRLLAAAQGASFDTMITGDQSIRHQQNLASIRLALVILPTNHWPTIEANADSIREAADHAGPGTCTDVAFRDRGPRRRKPPQR
jgi:hypothetical protein